MNSTNIPSSDEQEKIIDTVTKTTNREPISKNINEEREGKIIKILKDINLKNYTPFSDRYDNPYFSNPEDPRWEQYPPIDSHELCHYFETYNGGEETRLPCVLNHLDSPLVLDRVKKLLERHIQNRIISNTDYCDSRILLPIVEYNIENLENLDVFPFKPDFFNNENYLSIIEKDLTLDSKDFNSFPNPLFTKGRNAIINFLKTKTPKEFFMHYVRTKTRFPVRDPQKVSQIIHLLLQDTLEEQETNIFSTECYGKTELIPEAEINEQSEQSMKEGIFVDVDGTLVEDVVLRDEEEGRVITKKQLNLHLIEKLGNTKKKVTIFSDGDPQTQTEMLRSLGFPDNLLPVVAKAQFKGKILEIVIDNSHPAYQEFRAVSYFIPKGDHLLWTDGEKSFPTGIEDALKMSLNEINSRKNNSEKAKNYIFD